MSSDGNTATILCCLCGVPISGNALNMCSACLRTEKDITRGISKQLTMFFCRGCGRYQRGGVNGGSSGWANVALESPELLSMCLKKIKGLGKELKLVDARFIWTEPNSRRIKVRVTVQAMVMQGAILQQSCDVEFVVTNLQCTECQRSYTEHTWDAVVQVRQKVKHKRTFFWLEQLMLKHNVTDKALNVKEQPEGLDFFWGSKSNANALVQFLQSVVPCRTKESKRLISSDLSNNTHRYKFTIFVEIVPVCKNDLVLLPPRLASRLGGISPLLVCYKVTSMLHFIDPLTLGTTEINSEQYFRYQFNALLNSRQLKEYMIFDVEQQSPYSSNPHDSTEGKFMLSEVECARESDLGVNDKLYRAVTHLGRLLNPGDSAMGYDLENANLNTDIAQRLKGRAVPDVILVRKFYPKRNRSRKRKFKLASIPKESAPMRKHDVASREADFEAFMQDIEEDPETWTAINMYRRNPANAGNDEEEDEDAGLPDIPTDQLLELSVSGARGPTGPLVNPFTGTPAVVPGGADAAAGSSSSSSSAAPSGADADEDVDMS